MEPEDFEDYLQEAKNELVEKMVRDSEKKFTEGCIEGYKLIKDHGVECIDLNGDTKSSMEALNRMLGYFIQIEHYEKCVAIKKTYEEAFGKAPTPIFPNFEINITIEDE